jgi:hypothetical protein
MSSARWAEARRRSSARFVRDRVDHAYRRDGFGGGSLGAGAQVGLGLHGDDLTNAFGVVGEVGAGASPDFNDSAADAG